MRDEQTGESMYAAWADQDPLLREYYDTEWGMPVTSDDGVFERISLEGFQAGLSWLTVLRKRPAFRAAFADFEIARVAAFAEADVQRLLHDPEIIRNRRKIEATISNAKVAMQLPEQSGMSLAELVWSHMPVRSPTPQCDAEVPTVSPESTALAAELKRCGFRFVGPTTMYALMCAVGMVDAHLVSSHRRGCSGLWNADGTRRIQG